MLLLSNLFLLLNIQISTAITLFSKHSGDLTETIKAEMIATVCFCLVLFLDIADMLIAKEIRVNCSTVVERFSFTWVKITLSSASSLPLVFSSLMFACNVISQNDFTLLHPFFFDLLFLGTHPPSNDMEEHWIYLLFPCFTSFIIRVCCEGSSSLSQQIVSHPISSAMLFSNKCHSNFCVLLMAAHTAIRGAPAVHSQGKLLVASRATPRLNCRPPPPLPPGEHACMPWRWC